jgi:thiol-disulfide isomerase/thioredoxin
MKTRILAAFVVLALSLVGWRVPARGGEPTSSQGPDQATSAPEFTHVTTWLNAKPFRLVDQRGKVVIVHFWTNGCVNCIHNYPYYRDWQDRYKGAKDLLIVGIHTPEFDAEKDVNRIADRMAKNKLSFAVAVDNDGANWKAWHNRYWPCVYLVDKAGNIRHRWEGELGEDGYKTITKQIDALLAQPSPGRSDRGR